MLYNNEKGIKQKAAAKILSFLRMNEEKSAEQ